MDYPEQVREILRTLHRQESGKSMCSSDYYLTCPECHRRDMQFSNGWQCLWRDCLFQTYAIPSFDRVKYLLQRKSELRQVEELELLEGLDSL